VILRRPRVSERSLVIDFLAAHWRADHLFVRDPTWFDWQHLAADGSHYHALCGFTDEGRIAGFLGVMPLDGHGASVSTGIWIVAKDAPDRMLGLKLFGALEAHYGAVYIGSLGVNPAAASVLRMLGHKSGIAETFVLPSRHCAREVLSSGLAALAPEDPDPAIAIAEIGGMEEAGMLQTAHHPQKPLGWFNWRYGTGAPWPYRFFLVTRGTTRLVIVARSLMAEGSSCLRIVDCLGDIASAGRFAPAFGPLLAAEGHEYLELTVGGEELSVFDAAGFLRLPEGAVAPAYFDPFVKKNAALGWTIKTARETKDPAYIFRGDGDQDRPNRAGPAAPPAFGRPL
jgi:hypothetical protein